MKRVLEIDGGGAKGVIAATVLKCIEEEVGKPLFEIFDLIVGTSVGAVLGGVIASGKFTAKELYELLPDALKDTFKWRLRCPIWMPKYSRKAIDDTFNRHIGQDFLMKDCKTDFVCTAVSKIDGKTHFFKSWEEKDGNLSLVEAVKRSYAAPYYFGHIVDEAEKQVWLDGGVGNAKCPLGETFVDIQRKEWHAAGEVIHVLSIGNGSSKDGLSFKKAKKWGNLGDINFYVDPLDGGLARNQSIDVRVKVGYALTKLIPTFSFQRVDCEIPEKMDKMDKVKYSNDYKRFGEEMAKQVELQHFRG